MANLAGQAGAARGTGLADWVEHRPVLWAWAGMSTVLAACWFAGISPNNDLDDQLKLLKITQFLETGTWFDQTITGIEQPEPFVSHWPRILDLPYALLTWLLTPLTGAVTALRIAVLVTPLLLLLPALALFHRLMGIFRFERTGVAFILAMIVAGRSLFEFSPERIDYHNVEVVLLLLSIVLTFERRPMAAMANGAAVALALAIGLEFAPFLVIVMAVHVLDFVRGDEDGRVRLRLFGIGLVACALAAYVAAEPPARYGAVVCDAYSAPHLLGLCLAGLTFAFAAAIPAGAGNRLPRIAAIAVPAAATLALLVSLYPQCIGGPYAMLDAYVVDNWLHGIDQERSLLARPEFALSTSIASAAILFTGVFATLAYAVSRSRRDRDLVLFALLALLALVLACAYTRYLRYLPLFAAPGVLIALASLLRDARGPGAWLARPAGERLPPAFAFSLLPGGLLAFALVLHALLQPTGTTPVPAAGLAGGCNLDEVADHEWPADTRIMAPPAVGMTLLASGGGATVVAVPYHRAALGIERAYRFLDPATGDPRAYLERSLATHVAVCAWRGQMPAALAATYGLAAKLMGGTPPPWLTECPTDALSPLRIYRYLAGGGAACPVTSP